jgi:hypothetical protein
MWFCLKREYHIWRKRYEDTLYNSGSPRACAPCFLWLQHSAARSNRMTRTTYTLSANIPTTVGVRTGIFYGTSLYVGVPAAGLEPAQIWNYGVPE